MVDYTDANTSTQLTNVIFKGMLSALMIELDKPSADMEKIATKAASKTANELTAHPGDRGSYFVWARLKPTQQTKLALHPKSTLHQGRLSFALPAMVAPRETTCQSSMLEKDPRAIGQNKASLNDVEHAQPPLLQPPQMSANMQLDEAHHRPFYVEPHAFPIRNYRQT